MLCGIIAPSGGGARVLGLDVAARRRGGPRAHRLHVAEVLALRGPDRRREPALLRRRLRSRRRAIRRAGGRTSSRWPTWWGAKANSPANLSVGWKQRLALGCAIIHEPELVFLDEPTSGVDPLARKDFWELLYELAASGVTLFVTTHYMDEAANCSRLAFIYRGDIIAIGTPEEIRVREMRDEIFEVESPDADVTLAALEADEDVQEVYLSGARLHVNMGSTGNAAERLDARYRTGSRGRVIRDAHRPVDRRRLRAPRHARATRKGGDLDAATRRRVPVPGDASRRPQGRDPGCRRGGVRREGLRRRKHA